MNECRTWDTLRKKKDADTALVDTLFGIYLLEPRLDGTIPMVWNSVSKIATVLKLALEFLNELKSRENMLK